MTVDVVVQETFAKILDGVRTRIGDRLFDLWFTRCRPVSIFRGCLTLAVPNVFARDWIEEHYARVIEDAALDAIGTPLRVATRVDASLAAPAEEAVVALPPERPGESHGGYRLEAFVETPGNRLARRAIGRLAEGGAPGFTPLVLHGEEGTGKTHLLRGLLRALPEGARGMHVTADDFTNRFTFLLKTRQIERFRSEMSSVDVLCLDDVHELAARVATQRELKDLILLLERAGARVAIASRHHPKDIADLDPGLASVLLAGMVVRIDPPDDATAIGIVLDHLRSEGRTADSAIAAEVLRKAPGNVVRLERALRRVYAYAALSAEPVDRAFLAAHLDEIIGRGDPLERRIGILLSAVEERFGVTREDLASKRKIRSLSLPRGVAIFVMRTVLELTFKEVGRLMGERSHTSVYLIFRKFEEQLSTDADMAAFIREVGRRMRGPLS